MTEGDERLCPAMWLMDHLEDVAQGRGEISIGGMITILAVHHNLNLEGLEIVPGDTLINLRSMKSMHWIAEEDNVMGYIWLVANRNYAYLPDPERTVIYNPDNWLFYPDFEWDAQGDDDEDEEGEGDGGEGGAQAGPAGQNVPLGYEQQLAALQTGFGDLRADVGNLRSDVNALKLAQEGYGERFSSMTDSFNLLTSEFASLRADLRSWGQFQGWNAPSSSSAPPPPHAPRDD